MSLLMSCIGLAYGSWTHTLPFSNSLMPPWFNCLLTHVFLIQTMAGFVMKPWFCSLVYQNNWLHVCFLIHVTIVSLHAIFLGLYIDPLLTLSFLHSLAFTFSSSLPFFASLSLSLSLSLSISFSYSLFLSKSIRIYLFLSLSLSNWIN
jgi:hypothetical protein